jgi:glycosyltransferase involved in cell wall biosynthesis
VPLFSVITPVYNPPVDAFEACIDSMLAQTYADWEWCLVDDASTNPRIRKILERLARKDKRVRVMYRQNNGGIVAASQDALDIAVGDFIALLDHDDTLLHKALEMTAFKINDDETVDYIYSDENKIDEMGRPYDLFRKPAFDPIRLLGQNYCSHFSVIRSSLIDEVGGFRTGYEGSQDYDLILRVTERARTIAHIPEVLYNWRAVPGSAANQLDAKPYALDSAERAVQDHLRRVNIQADVSVSSGGFIQVKPTLSSPPPKVSIVIPTRGDAQRVWGVYTCLIDNAVASILEKSTYTNYEIVVVLDVKESKPIHPVSLPNDPRVTVVHYDAPFNFSDKCNVGVQRSSGDVVILLNDDTQIIDPDWIETLVSMLQFPGVAMVGPMLLLEDSRIQSAGHTNIPSPHNIGSGLSSTQTGKFGMFGVTRRVSGVTAACAAIHRSIYEELGGFSIDFPACFNDLDFGNKVLEAGYHIVWTPLARLYHFESLTRDPTVAPHEMAMLEKRWKRYFGREDYSRQPA